MRAVTSNPDAATHGEPLKEADNRFGIGGQLGVQAVFIGPESAAIGIIALCSGFVQFGNIAAGAKGTFAFRVDQHKFDRIIMAPVFDGHFNRGAHVIGHSVERLGALECDQASAALGADGNVTHLSANIWRATITRMISFVPSRIW